jgi:hypothetical protein
VLLFFSLIGLVLGLWWLIYFTRRAVRVRFVGEAAADLAREFPLSMSFVAWLLIAGGVIVLIEVVFPYPLLLFGFILRGWSARVLFFVFMLVSFAAGIGMLKKRPEGHWLAVGYFTFGLLNVLSYLVVPNAGARLMDAVREISPGTPLMGNVQELYMKFGVVLGLLGGAIILWLLITRRHAFNRVSG